jgi:hypothetical protein
VNNNILAIVKNIFMRNLTKLDTFFVIFVVILFLSFSSIVIFKRDWLDSIFYGESKEELVSLVPSLEDDGLVETPALVDLSISGDGEKASVVLNLEKEFSPTGIELFLLKTDGLVIEEMACEPPFECLFFDVDGNNVSLTAIISADSIETIEPGDVLVGTLTYSGSGSLYLYSDSQSFVADVEDPEFNILNVDEKEFLL